MSPIVQSALEHAGESALIAFGDKAQMVKTVEECAELIVQLSKRLNNSPTTNEQIVDEVCDVLIMTMQMRKIFGAEAADARILFKLNRTMEFIRSRKEAVSAEAAVQTSGAQ